MLQSLLEIDEISKDTAEAQLPDGQTAYAGYFFARFSKDNRQAAENTVRAYIKNINHIFVEEFEEDAPLNENAEIAILSGQAGEDFINEAMQNWGEEESHLHFSVHSGCYAPFPHGRRKIDGILSNQL